MTTIEKACKGNSEAMKTLYDENKTEIMCLCQSLLEDEKAACAVFVRVFRNMWDALLNGEVQNKEEFHQKSVKKAVSLCKAKISKKDSKAFRIPQNKNFMDTIYSANTILLNDNVCVMVLKNLPILHRFIYIMHTVCDYNINQIAEVLKTNNETIQIAVNAEDVNINRIIAAACAKSKTQFSMTKTEFHNALLSAKEETPVSQDITADILLEIDRVCEPILKKAKKKNMRIMLVSAVSVVCVCAVIFVVLLIINSNAEKTPTESSPVLELSDTASESSIDINATYYADIAIQDYGTITVALDAKAAPKTVENFVSLAEGGFYDGLTFHRIIEGFMMQGGNNGTGGSEQTIIGEFSANGIENNLSHTRGAISMARSNDYNSASSQFFIVHKDSTFLDGKYAAFGYVTNGIEVVDAVCEAANPTDDDGTIPADEQPIITSITIRKVDNTESSTGSAA